MSNMAISIKMLLCLMSVPVSQFLPTVVPAPLGALMKHMHQTLHLCHQTRTLPANVRVREKMRAARTKTEWAF